MLIQRVATCPLGIPLTLDYHDELVLELVFVEDSSMYEFCFSCTEISHCNIVLRGGVRKWGITCILESSANLGTCLYQGSSNNYGATGRSV